LPNLRDGDKNIKEKTLQDERRRIDWLAYDYWTKNYDPYTVDMCRLRGVGECDCPPGGPMGCCPWDDSMTPEEVDEQMKALHADLEVMRQERLHLLRLALVEEFPHVAISGMDPLQILVDEYKELVKKRKSMEQASFAAPSSKVESEV